jgi:uncharacterized protein (TIGR02246 family)
MSRHDEHSEIHAVVQGYIDALADSDTTKMASAFHPDATISGDFGNGVQVSRVADTVVAYMKTLPPTTVHSPKFKGRVLSVLQVGNHASAVIEEDELQGMNFTTFFHLHKVGGQWKITAKATGPTVKP